MLLKRLGLPLLSVAVAVLLAVVVDRAPFATAAPGQTVTPSVPVQIPITIQDISPGEIGSAGTLRVKYEGAAPAWVGLDSDLVGTLAGGESPLEVTITGDNGRYSARGFNQVVGLFAPGETVAISVAYALPHKASNAYQAQNATLLLQLHAVEAANNTLFELGRAVGPASWSKRIGPVAVAWNQQEPQTAVAGAPSSADLAPAPAPHLAEGALTPMTPATAAVVPTSCCQCLANLLWVWLAYAFLLVLAMLGAFYMGWRLAFRRQRPRFRPKRIPREPARQNANEASQ